jgi:sugar/nucleoside kinase (ribokinase family)
MSFEFDVMCAGHLCLDVIPRFPDTGTRDIAAIMRPGRLVNMEEAKISTGGPVSNTGINMKTLGNRVCFCARTGGDAFGKLTLDLLREKGNAEGIHVVEDAASSYTVVIAPPGIDRIFLHNPGTNNSFGPEDLDPELIGRCRHFHFGYPPLMDRMFAEEGETLAEIFRIAKAAGATTSCDMSLPDPDSPSGKADWRNILEKILPHVDIFLPSIEETFYMLEPKAFLRMKADHAGEELIDVIPPPKYSELAASVLDMGAKMVSLKSGHRGFYFRTAETERFADMGAAKPEDSENWGGRELWAAAFTVENFGSATGSGDSAIAGFLTGFLHGRSIEQCLRLAVTLGFQNVQVPDAVSGIRSREETLIMADSDAALINPRLSEHGWEELSNTGIWRPA